MPQSSDIAVTERAKYEKLWAGKGYRSGRSPGAAVARHVLKVLRPNPGDTIIDYGCGPGKACAIFRECGLKPIGVDIAANALDSSINGSIPFVQATLWRLPILLSDWCYCTDVLEHLPEDKIDLALAGIASRTRKGGYIQVATIYDRNGPRLTGRHLHLTVKPMHWWVEVVARHFRVMRAVGHLHFPMRKWQFGMVVAV